MQLNEYRALIPDVHISTFCPHLPKTFLKIMVAKVTLSATAAKSLGLGRLMSSLASRTAAMIAAAMTSVEAKRSRWRSSASRAFARFISPIPKA